MDHLGNGLAPILVTGAAGYLGRHVLSNLEKKRVTFVATSRNGNVGLACDLANIGATRVLLERIKPLSIIHCAAMVPKSASTYADVQAAEASIAMIETLTKVANCPIVFASSMTVYMGVKDFPTHEDSVPPPAIGYAYGKWKAEKILLARNFPGDVTLRLPGLFGFPRRSGLLYNAAKSFLTYKNFEPAISPCIWAAMAVQDAAEYLVTAAMVSHHHPPQPVNIGYEGEFSVPTAIAKIAASCGVSWEPPLASVQPFSICTDRLKARYGILAVTFQQRIEELVEFVRHDMQENMVDSDVY